MFPTIKYETKMNRRRSTSTSCVSDGKAYARFRIIWEINWRDNGTGGKIVRETSILI